MTRDYLVIEKRVLIINVVHKVLVFPGSQKSTSHIQGELRSKLLKTKVVNRLP